MESRKRFALSEDCAALLLYILLAVLLTYPLALRMNDSIAGNGDAWYNLWNMWRIKEALAGQDAGAYHTNFVFYPGGAKTVFTDTAWAIVLPSIPFQLLGLATEYYNILMLIGFILSAYAMYLLAKYLVHNSHAAFVAGLIFSFSADHFIHASVGQVNLVNMQWVPFYILFLIKTVREKGRYFPALAGMFAFATAMTSQNYLMLIVVFTLLFLAYLFIAERRILGRETISRLLVALGVFSVLIVPFIAPMAEEALSTSYASKSTGVWFSADLMSFIVPSPLHPLFGGYSKDIYSRFTGSLEDSVNYLGFAALALSAYSAARIRKARPWVLAAAAFFVLALGPVLHVSGSVLIPAKGINLGKVAESFGINLPDKTYDFIGGKTPYDALNDNIVVPLPYILFQKFLPFFSIMRVPSRFTVLLMLALAVLAAYALDHIMRKYPGKKIFSIELKYAVALLFSGLVVFESLSVPLPVSGSYVPAFYKELGSDKGSYAIAEVPFKIKAMYYQTVHKKPLIYGYLSYIPSDVQKRIEDSPAVRKFSEVGSPLDILPRDISFLRENNVKYIILHENSIDKKAFARINSILSAALNQPPKIYDDVPYDTSGGSNRLFVYEVN